MTRDSAKHKVRIIGGRWKRTPVPVPDLQGLRPTPDRVRETLFNWLGHDLSGRVCLDLFAGTGALGLEAASRGADSVLLVESDRLAARSISQVIEKLGAQQVRLLIGDALVILGRLRAAGDRFDLVFLDPPFGRKLLARVLPMLSAILSPGARIYVESESPLHTADIDTLLGPGWQLLRAEQAGQVFYHLLGEAQPEKGEP